MKISVVVPTYGRAELLIRCLTALTAQSMDKTQYEVLVVNDGPDRSKEMLIRDLRIDNDCEIRFLSTAKKAGPAAARNLGWLNASGRLIAFTDDDTIPDRDWLSSIWREYRDEELCAFTGTVRVPVSSPPTDYERNVLNLETAEFVTANCVCTKAALLAVGGFDERFEIAWREDSDLHFKLLESNIPIRKINAVVVHPVREAPWGISIKEQKKVIYNALLYKKYPRLYRQRIKARPSWTYYLMCGAMILYILAFWFGWAFIMGLALGIHLWLLLAFARKRLEATSKSPKHVLEMLVTSLIIPFVSLFWQFYGAVKFRVFFL